MKFFVNIYVILAVCCIGVDVKRKVQLSVFYESACSDSKHFILEQLHPTIHKLEDYIDLQLIPFGKASSINNGGDGFECQHGPPECFGNLIQDCTLNEMKSYSDVHKVEYLACEMETMASTRGDIQCIVKSNVPHDPVRECVYLGPGTLLQLDSERLTKLVNPKFIPTIVLDGVFDQATQNKAFNDLMGTICDRLRNVKPCKEYFRNN